MGWIKRLVMGLVVLTVLAIVIPLISYAVWYRSMLLGLEADSRIASTALGEIEYATVGEGTPYLYLHGTPGGYDQTLIGWEVSPELYVGQKLISVSRPGYLRTPLESGANFEEQADLFAALLDELSIEQAVVVGASGGGYPGIQFALRHPDRVVALVLYAPALGYEPLPENPGGTAGFTIDFTNWAVGGIFMNALIPSIISEFDPSDPKMVETARRLVLGAAPVR